MTKTKPVIDPRVRRAFLRLLDEYIAPLIEVKVVEALYDFGILKENGVASKSIRRGRVIRVGKGGV